MDKQDLDIEEILVDESSEDDLREVSLDSNTFSYFAFIVAIIGLVVLFQTVRLGMFNHETYAEAALANMTEKSYQEAPRGLIKDRSGDPLLKNKQAFKVYLSPHELPEEPTKRKQSLEKIAEVLKIEKKKLEKNLDNYDWSLGPPLIEHELTHKQLVNLSTKDIRGIKIKPGFQRRYPNPFSFSHLLGFVGPVNQKDLNKNPNLKPKDEIGKAGLELEYDQTLRGQDGRKIRFLNASGELKEKKVIKKPQAGETLKTSIDAEFQKAFHRELKEGLQSLSSNSAVGLAMNPRNGSVLALTAVPGYEGNNVSKYLNKPGNPLFNKITKGRYNPGSTIKPLVALAGLEEGIISPTKRIYSPGYLKVENPYFPNQPSIFEDWKPHGWVDMQEALAKSSNVYFYVLGGGHDRDSLYGLKRNRKGLGIDKLKKWWSTFGLGSKTEIDMPSEKAGVLPDPSWKREHIGTGWRVGDTYNASIGQGSFTVTPIGLLNYISTIGNGGKLYRPNIAAQRKKKTLKDLSSKISQNNIEVVKSGMEAAVEKPYGTANLLNSLPMEIAAKTGSAEVGKKSVNALVTGFTPVDNPKLSILVLVEGAEEGSLDAVPIAREVFGWYCKNRLKNCDF